MKNYERLIVPLSVFIILVFIKEQSWAQEYKPFIEYNKYWDVGRDTGEGICRGTVDRFFFISDTIINDVVYYQLAFHPTAYNPGAPPYCEPLGGFSNDVVSMSVFFREDTMLQEVYRLGTENYDEEVLWFEFDKHVGDTVGIAYCSYDYFIHLPITDEEIVSEYGYERRKFKCGIDDNYSFELVEGIGYTDSHPFYGHCPLAVAGSIGCVYYGDNPVDWNCANFITSARGLLDSQIKIYPNPVVDKLSFLDVDRGINIKIFNSVGQLINSVFINQDYEINFADYSAGMYIVQILDNRGGIITIEKVVKS